MEVSVFHVFTVHPSNSHSQALYFRNRFDSNVLEDMLRNSLYSCVGRRSFAVTILRMCKMSSFRNGELLNPNLGFEAFR